MTQTATILWFSRDLRLSDNPAFAAALERGCSIVPLFIYAPEEEGAWAPGAASKWWLHQSLQSLDAALRERGSRLIIRRGPTLGTLRELVGQVEADAVLWNRRYEPALIARDSEIKNALQADGLQVESFNSALLFEPWEIKNKSGDPYRVFTPFWRACVKKGVGGRRSVVAEMGKRTRQSTSLQCLDLDELGLLPKCDWARGFDWQPGESGARLELRRFVREGRAGYKAGRDLPAKVGTSQLSPHLHFGEISPREVWEAVRGEDYGRQLGWREFAHHLLYHFPHTPIAPLRPTFAKFPWAKDAKALRAWQRGRTGFPLVDAGMRELWATGWMHNRVRMVVASFLVKDLLISWQEGARWFWDTLVDADLANNTLGWQWTAGCGADAAPFFRIFNPVSQGEKFDPDGDYVRRWCPELAKLSAQWIHKPWKAPSDVLEQAGVELGRTYPKPIIRHTVARMRAMAAYEDVKAAGRA